MPTIISTSRDTLFNPAFCAALSFRIAQGHYKVQAKPLPLSFMYLAIPAVLHRATRESLPRSTDSSMFGWLRDNPRLAMDITTRVQNLRPHVSNAIVFAIKYGVLVNTDGDLSPGTLLRRPPSVKPTGEWESCMKAATFFGKWLALSGADEATVLGTWGFKP